MMEVLHHLRGGIAKEQIRVSLIVVLTVAMLAGCSKSIDSNSQSFPYPLASGNRWTYYLVSTQEHDDPDRIDILGTVTLKAAVEEFDTIEPGVTSCTTRA